MATMQNTFGEGSFRVIHPLHDSPEKKCESEGLGPIEMTPAVRISLKLLRGYLFLMTGMLLYHVADMAGLFHSGR